GQVPGKRQGQGLHAAVRESPGMAAPKAAALCEVPGTGQGGRSRAGPPHGASERGRDERPEQPPPPLPGLPRGRARGPASGLTRMRVIFSGAAAPDRGAAPHVNGRTFSTSAKEGGRWPDRGNLDAGSRLT